MKTSTYETRVAAATNLLDLAAKAYAESPTSGTMDVLKWAALTYADAERTPRPLGEIIGPLE